MILSSSLRKEFSRTAIIMVVALLGILVTVSLVKFLGLAAGGEISVDAVATLLGFGVLMYLPVVISASVFVAILMTMTRMYRDSEMIVWNSSGLGLKGFVGPTLRYVIPMVLVVALTSLVVTPWAIGQRATYQARLEHRDETSQIVPGVFRESKESDQVFFVDHLNENDAKVSNVFVQTIHNNQMGIIVADKGFTQTNADGGRFIILQHGRRYEGEPGKLNYAIVDFNQAELRMTKKSSAAVSLSIKSMNLGQLMAHPTLEAWAELHWRFGMPISLLILSVLALPLSYVNTRGGRSANLIFALLAYMVYYNTISIAQAWVIQGRVPYWLGAFPVHFVFLIGTLLFLRRREALFSWRTWFRRQLNQRPDKSQL